MRRKTISRLISLLLMTGVLVCTAPADGLAVPHKSAAHAAESSGKKKGASKKAHKSLRKSLVKVKKTAKTLHALKKEKKGGAVHKVARLKEKSVQLAKEAPRVLSALALAQPVSAESVSKAVSHARLAEGVPYVLSQEDVQKYREVFAAERNGHFEDGNALAKGISDPLLQGHISALKLLHPSYKPSFSEMKDWLSQYGELSQARAVFNVAREMRSGNQTIFDVLPVNMKLEEERRQARAAEKEALNNAQADGKTRNSLLNALQANRKNGDYQEAVTLFAKESTQKALGSEVWSGAGVKLSRSLYDKGYYENAEAVARTVVARADRLQPEAFWLGGLSAYRRGEMETAASLFRQLAENVPANSQYFASAAWWAGQSFDKLGDDDKADKYYTLASQDPYSFYGQLATERVKGEQEYSFGTPSLGDQQLEKLMQDNATKRVIALVQVGEYGLAQQELKALNERLPYDLDESLLGLANALNLPSASVKVAKELEERNNIYLGSLYPVLDRWEPQGGYKVSKALLHAVMRQESTFDPYVLSRTGASGLMQIMPGTAKYLVKKTGRENLSAAAVLNPSVNMGLGQDYLAILEKQFNGNLIYMIAAYNAGPGNVKKWIARDLGEGNPALFVESIPFPETREYVRKVMANMMMYRHRFHESHPALTAMSKGGWPVMTVALANVAEKRS